MVTYDGGRNQIWLPMTGEKSDMVTYDRGRNQIWLPMTGGEIRYGYL